MKRMYFLIAGLIFLLPLLVQAQKGKVLWERGGEISAEYFSFSPDSLELLTGGQYTDLEIRNAETGNVVRKLPFFASVLSASWSPKGEAIAVYANDSLYFLNSQTGEILRRQGAPYVRKIYYSPEGNYLVSDNGITRLSDFADVSAPFKRPGTWDVELKLLPGDSSALLLKSDSLVMVSFPGGEVLKHYALLPKIDEDEFSSVALHPSTGRAAIALFNKGIFIIDIAGGSILHEFTDETYQEKRKLAFTPDGKSLAIGDNNFSLIDIATGNISQQATILVHPEGKIHSGKSDRIFIGAYSGYGDCLPANYDRMQLPMPSLVIWNVANKERVIPGDLGHSTRIVRLTFSDDFKSITSIDRDSLSLTWNTPTGELLKKEKVADFTFVSMYADVISPSGKYRLKTNAAGRQLSLWDNQTDALLYMLPYMVEMTSVYGRTFSPDEQYILASLEYYYMGTGQFPSQELHVWSTETGKKIDSIPIPCFLSHIQVSGNNGYIAGATFDSRIIVIGGEGLLTSVENSQPQNFLKTSIYPNPLKNEAVISYSIVKPELLKISVHDILGREIIVLKNEFTDRGGYTIPFKSKGLPDGMYFYKITAGSKTITKSFGIFQ